MKKLRILVLAHEDLIPPDHDRGMDESAMLDCQTEYDVCATLREAGHGVTVLGLRYDLGALLKHRLSAKRDQLLETAIRSEASTYPTKASITPLARNSTFRTIIRTPSVM